jgi:hypothetical protein
MAKPWSGKPDPLDVTWCWFPEVLRGKDGPVQGPKPRPALVLEVNTKVTPPMVRVAFGTSQKTDDMYAGEFQISSKDGDVFRKSGCDEETKFDLRRNVWLPYTDEWFGIKPKSKGTGPVIGRVEINNSVDVRNRLRAASQVFLEAEAKKNAVK